MVKPKLFMPLVLVVVVIFIALATSLPAGAPGEAGGAAVVTRPGIGVVSAAAEPQVLTDGGRYSSPAGEHLPLMIRWRNWQPEFGQAIVYAREFDLDGMLALNAPVEKMVMVASYQELSQVMARADELHAAGVTTVGLNTENGPGMTPGDEMQTLDSPDPNVNIVARMASLARQNGFRVMWGPVRNVADNVSDATIRAMMAAGMNGLALQEQKFIEVSPAAARLAQVNQTRDRYLRLARETGIDDFRIDVQIMHERCPNLDNCVAFVQGLEAIPVNSIAIWSNGPIPAAFVSAIRSN